MSPDPVSSSWLREGLPWLAGTGRVLPSFVLGRAGAVPSRCEASGRCRVGLAPGSWPAGSEAAFLEPWKWGHVLGWWDQDTGSPGLAESPHRALGMGPVSQGEEL